MQEGIPCPDVHPPSNAEVCAIFDTASVGAFQLLDSQSRAPKPDDKAFCREVWSSHSSNAFFGSKDGGVPHEMSELHLTKDEAFVVHHFAASVTYAVDGFLDKNDNKLSDTFEASLRASPQPFIAAIIHAEGHKSVDAGERRQSTAVGNAGMKMAPPPSLPGSSGFSSVGKTFLNDLRKLMRELEATQPHFVRCLKPNKTLAPRQMDRKMVLVQMASSGLMEAVKLMQASYPSRSTYEELLRVFGNQLPKSVLQSHSQSSQVGIRTAAGSRRHRPRRRRVLCGPWP